MCVCVCVCVLVTQSCLILHDSTDYNLPGSSVHGILQAKILDWVAIPFLRGSSQPRDQTLVSCIAGKLLHCRWILYQLSHQGNHLQPVGAQAVAVGSGNSTSSQEGTAAAHLWLVIPVGECESGIARSCIFP